MADGERQPPPTKKRKLSLGRFKEPRSSEEIQMISKGYVPPNTAKSTAWGVKVFQNWRVREKRERQETSR